MNAYKKALIGRRIIDVRELSKEELDNQGWHTSPPILVLDNGTEITPSCDEEGNDGGALFIDLAPPPTEVKRG